LWLPSSVIGSEAEMLGQDASRTMPPRPARGKKKVDFVNKILDGFERGC
jgi:hypothetical protein